MGRAMVGMGSRERRAGVSAVLRRYAVPIAVVCTVAAVAVAAPSRPDPSTAEQDRGVAVVDPGGATHAAAPALDEPAANPPATAEAVSAADPAAPDNRTDGGVTGAGRSASGAPLRTDRDVPAPAAKPKGVQPQEDRSRCGEGGVWQQDITTISPPCVPRFHGDNGGATAPGVTRTSIRVVVLRDDYGPYVEPVLQTAGVAASPAEEAGAIADFARFFEKRYEWYGRRVEWIYHRASCEMNTAASCAVAQAKEIVARYRPFAVVVPLPNRAEFFSAMTRAGVVTVGGWHTPRSTYLRERPYRYDWVPDGTHVMAGLADYWCGKLAGKRASRAGDGQIRELPRRLGILAPADPTGRSHASELAAFVRQGCGEAAKPPVIYRYDGDFGKSQEQFQTIVETMRDDGVTTVTCLCDPVRPIFLTNAADLHGFFPEHLLSGMYASDLDVFGRLYSQAQWRNAFGPVLQPPGLPVEQRDDYKAYQDVGAEYRCYPCQATFTWMHLAAIQLQLAGPRLTAQAVEAGLLGGPRLRQSTDPAFPRIGFSRGRYTAMLDAREVAWSPTAASSTDGRAGSYVCAETACPRYRPGQWTRGEAQRS